MSRSGNVTPEQAARKAAELLDLASNKVDPEIVLGHVALADAWTRLYTALRSGNEPGELTIRETEIDGIDVVIVPEQARDLLEALGWTPPAGER